MTKPAFKTRVVHSKSKPAWNVVSTTLGAKYKIARVPYVPSLDADVMDNTRGEARKYADFISYCFNNSGAIEKTLS